jgi:serine/threonine protein kinase/pimeloyl-ACP methyl ester carboxylesterase
VSTALDQTIRFCTSSDGVRIAYATVGSGPPLVKAANWLSHLEFDSKSPVWRHWIRELSRFHTLIRYDERGCGLSDWAAEEYSLEAWVRDLEAVVDSLELERFPLLGISQGGPIAIAYAIRHPERVSHLILHGSYARGRSRWGLSEHEREERELLLSLIRVGWGKDNPAFRQVFTSLFIPDGTPEQVNWFNELQRVSAPPANAARMCAAFYDLDVRALAPQIRIPTLVLHGTGDLRIPFAEGRLLASLIPGARLVPIESRNHLILESEPGWHRFLAEVRSFLGVPADPAAGSRRQRIEMLFDQALDLGPSDRAELLAREGAVDPGLRDEVEALLSAAEASGVTVKLAHAVARPAASQITPPATRTIAQYEILEQVGAGGMGVVYKARDQRLQRLVALKLLPPALSADQELKRRFLQEAQAIASLDHPNLCTIFEIAEPEEGHLMIVMPFYAGETLKQKLGRGPLPVRQALDYALQIADGLAHAHAVGVVHRDIKPANLVVTSGDRIKILDFGIAKLSQADANFTRTGAVLGTAAYMSPEQARGDRVDQRSDLWALGVVLYEMMTGRSPFTADSLEAVFYALQWRHPEEITIRRPEVPPGADRLVRRLLEKDPAHRYQDARAAAAALDSLSADMTTSLVAATARSQASTSSIVRGDSPAGVQPDSAEIMDHLERARAAFARSAWREAYAAFSAADADNALEAEDLEHLAEAAWWLSNGPACVRARERAYRKYVQRREPRAAAAVALALAEDHFHRLARSVGQGWLRRAERHLKDFPEFSEQGWLHRLRFVVALEGEGKLHEALESADRALEVARRVGDIDLETLALQDRGRALVVLGRLDEGMALIDEAMAAATAGELTPRTTGRAYCNMLSICERLGDVGRAAEWYEAAYAWCEPHSESGYPGICRVHRAGVLRLRGALAKAEHEARRAAEELEGFLTDVAGEAFYELGEIRLRRGDLAAAGEMFARAHSRGRDPQPGLALLRVAEGKVEAARSMIERALGEPGLTMLHRAKLLPAAVEIRVACTDIPGASEAASELETITATYTAPALVAFAAQARGRVELAQGRADLAISNLRRACRILTEIDLPLELAQTRLLLSRAYSEMGNTDEAEMEERTARAAMEGIGAGPPLGK